MKAHTKQEFQLFMSQLLPTNANLGFFSDFKKCNKNVKQIEMKLHALNYLVGKENMEEAIHDLWTENPAVFTVLDILIAVRTKDKKLALNRLERPQRISDFFTSEEGVQEFIKDTGLTEVLRSKRVTNLVDYVFGVEVGLDTNARKNRSGKIMAGMVTKILTKAGVEFETEVSSKEFPTVKEALGVDDKHFDFVVRTAAKTYLIEVNFYNQGGGSKPNEVARSFTELALKINACEGYEFVWVTDGIGWECAKGKLEEAFYTIPRVYNLETFKDFVKSLKQ